MSDIQLSVPSGISGMKIAAMINGIVGGIMAFNSGAPPIVVALGIFGASMALAAPLLSVFNLVICAFCVVAAQGLGNPSLLPVSLMLVGAGLSLVAVDGKEITEAGRRPWLFGFSYGQAFAFLVMLELIVIMPSVLYPVFLMRILCAALFACAFNLMIGYVGLLSFGHAAYFGMGSYVAAWTMKTWHLDASIAIALGGLTGAAFGLVLGYLAIRRSGIYFAMITLALAQMVYFFCLEAPFTGGEDGIQQVPRGFLFGFIDLSNDMTMYWVVAGVFLSGFLMIHRIIHSPFGQVLKGIRENEPRATSLGYRTDDYKLIAFVLSCAITGVAGGTKSLVFGIATLTDVHYGTSGEVVLTTLLGGLGTVFGPAMGALVVTSMENYLAQFGAWVTVTQGVIFMVCVLAFRRGIVGELAARLRSSK